MAKKIVIDPGHGGLDPGAVGNGLQEKNINLNIALKLREKLTNYADVILTRNTDMSVSLSERTASANKAGANLFLSIHVNAGGGTGFESFVYTNPRKETSQIRQIIHEEVAGFYAVNGFRDRGMKQAGFAVLRETSMPAVLLENLFIDTAQDAAKLRDPGFCEEIAGAIAGGVIKALDIQEPIETPQIPSHWAEKDFKRLMEAGLVKDQHNLYSTVTWGEMTAVVARLLDKHGWS